MKDIAIRVIRHGRPIAAHPVLIEALNDQARSWFKAQGYPENGIACGLDLAEEIARKAQADGLSMDEVKK